MSDLLSKVRRSDDKSADTIAQRFERRVASISDRLAIVTDEVSLTYRALDLMAGRIAGGLASLSFQTEKPIVLFIKDEVTRLAAMLAALKANRIFILLAPTSPQNWLVQVIEDSGAAQIIVDASTRSVADSATLGAVTITAIEELTTAEVRSPPLSEVNQIASPSDTAYIVYTSGSTGRPKGVAISHRSLLRRDDVWSAVMGLSPGNHFAKLTASGLSADINSALLPLLWGGCVFPFDLPSNGLQKLAPWLIAQKITYVSFSGSLLRTWLTSLPDSLRFPELRFVVSWGEQLYAEDVIRVSRHLEGDWRFGYSYSSTETGVITGYIITPSNIPELGSMLPIGRPVDGIQVCIADDTGAPVQSGEIGEIIVRNRYLAPGYWNNPELTAKAFETDPQDSTNRIYRTGDLGRWRSDGMLEHMGRKGRRIKLRGYNIEPYQVECELMREANVRDAVVLLYSGATGQEPSLVGYVVAPPNASASDMRKGLANRLPSYMVPSQIVVLKSFPLASSGKIDLKALPPPNRDETRAALRSPSNDCEFELLSIWQKVLKLPAIGIDDDFFELGGTSLQALMVFAEIETRLGCSLSPTTIVQAPTIARLADFIRTNADTHGSQSLVPLRTSGTGQPLFLLHNRYCFVMYYRHLLAALKSDRPIFGVQPPPLDGKHRIPRTVETMAANYVAEIRRVQPHGPYFIAGHSFGGLLSFEIAQQLVRAGERVSFLGLIDTGLFNAPGEGRPELSRGPRVGQQLFAFFERLLWIREVIWKRWYVLKLRAGRPVRYDHRPVWYDWLCCRASRNYVPKPYTGHITMFSSAGNSERQAAHWGPLAGHGLTMVEVPATHDDIVLPPHSKLLARHFDDCLDKIGKDFISPGGP